jgi:pyruvate formate lyase activating enzyme
MLIKGIQKTSLIDYPNKICCIVFLPNCNFRCPYCYNIDLILNPEKLPRIDQFSFFNFLKEKKDWLDAVTICGGEPTLQKDLPDFCRKIKLLNYLVKLDTNGTNPEMIKELIDKKLVDYIALDVKAPLNKYKKVTDSEIDSEKIKQSISILKNSKIDYEFRTTLLPLLHSKKDILEIAKLLKGSKKYYLQQFIPGDTLNKTFKNAKTFTEPELQKFRESIKNNFEVCEIRGI